MAKRKSANNDLQNIHTQIKIELHERCEEEFEDTLGSNQNPQLEGQTTQWSKAKGQEDKQRSTKLCTEN